MLFTDLDFNTIFYLDRKHMLFARAPPHFTFATSRVDGTLHKNLLSRHHSQKGGLKEVPTIPSISTVHHHGKDVSTAKALARDS